MSNQPNQPSSQVGVVTEVDQANRSITINTPTSAAGKLQMTQDLLNNYANQSDHLKHVQAQVDAMRNAIVNGQALSAGSIFGINPISYGQWMVGTHVPETLEEKAQREERERIEELETRTKVMNLFLTQEPAYREAFLMDHRSNVVQLALDEDKEPHRIYVQGYYFKLQEFEEWHANAELEDAFLKVVN